jgi:uncharacterized protein YegP (UPF0339 family)
MAGYYALGKGKTGKFSFNLKSGNHQVVLSSQAYESRAAAVEGIASVQRNASDDGRFERKTAKNGESYFVLKATNGQVVGKSEMYASAAAMEKGIASVKANGASTVVKESP